MPVLFRPGVGSRLESPNPATMLPKNADKREAGQPSACLVAPPNGKEDTPDRYPQSPQPKGPTKASSNEPASHAPKTVAFPKAAATAIHQPNPTVGKAGPTGISRGNS